MLNFLLYEPRLKALAFGIIANAMLFFFTRNYKFKETYEDKKETHRLLIIGSLYAALFK